MARLNRKKMGRPTMDPKPVRVTIRLGPGDVDALDALAKDLGGANLSEALRHLVREYAKTRKETKR
jgi:metal-responsive CopG/Arc/MetJ family transcriptional regulator